MDAHIDSLWAHFFAFALDKNIVYLFICVFERGVGGAYVMCIFTIDFISR